MLDQTEMRAGTRHANFRSPWHGGRGRVATRGPSLQKPWWARRSLASTFEGLSDGWANNAFFGKLHFGFTLSTNMEPTGGSLLKEKVLKDPVRFHASGQERRSIHVSNITSPKRSCLR